MSADAPDPDEPHRIRVRYCETDRMGVAHHGSYVAWFEEARTEWLRRRGKSYREMEEGGVFLQVVSLAIQYLKPTTYDDELLISLWVTERAKVAVTMQYEVHRVDNQILVATGETRLAAINSAGKLRRLPKEI
jgi:acyl-CoA thioester hydrolase